MDRVNKPHSMVGHYKIKMCAAFMTSSLQSGATLVDRNSGYCLFSLIAGRSLALIKCTAGVKYRFVSGLVYTKRIKMEVLEEVCKKLVHLADN